MTAIDTFAAKTHLASLLDQVLAGEHITITRHGTPIARGFVPVRLTGPNQVRETIAKLKQFSKGQTLGGLKVKDFINEGRRSATSSSRPRGCDLLPTARASSASHPHGRPCAALCRRYATPARTGRR